MRSENALFHPLLRVFCVLMIIIIAIINQSGPKEEFIRSADAVVTSVEYKQESKTKGPLTEYQYLTGSYDVNGGKYSVSQRHEMPTIEYKVGETFPVFYDARSPHDTIDSEHIPQPGIGGGKMTVSDGIALTFILPFMLTLIGSFIHVFQSNKRISRSRVR